MAAKNKNESSFEASKCQAQGLSSPGWPRRQRGILSASASASAKCTPKCSITSAQFPSWPVQGHRRHAAGLLAPAWGSVGIIEGAVPRLRTRLPRLATTTVRLTASSATSLGLPHQFVLHNSTPPLFLVPDHGMGFLMGRQRPLLVLCSELSLYGLSTAPR